MQTKSSHRALKWTLFVGIASLASACVIGGDPGNGDDEGDGGEDGTDNTSGTKNTSGTTNTGGSKAGSNTGGTSAGSSAAGAMTGGGGGGSDYTPGLCEEAMPVPTEVPSCDPKAGDGEVATDCLACLKARCCSEWQTCYGSTPASACGWGPTEEADGQFDCIRACYTKAKKADPNGADEDILAACDTECLLQCDDEDFVNQDTIIVEACAFAGPDNEPFSDDDCALQCFPAE